MRIRKEYIDKIVLRGPVSVFVDTQDGLGMFSSILFCNIKLC